LTADAAKAPVSLFAWINKRFPSGSIGELLDGNSIEEFNIDSARIASNCVWEVNSGWKRSRRSCGNQIVSLSSSSIIVDGNSYEAGVGEQDSERRFVLSSSYLEMVV
jgi:hypothetical protein